MTKIKNTKKGMAKKTLSMSLVVAMLATSNVPVWAAEFSDGAVDAAFTSEVPVVENEDVASARGVVADPSTRATIAASASGIENNTIQIGTNTVNFTTNYTSDTENEYAINTYILDSEAGSVSVDRFVDNFKFDKLSVENPTKIEASISTSNKLTKANIGKYYVGVLYKKGNSDSEWKELARVSYKIIGDSNEDYVKKFSEDEKYGTTLRATNYSNKYTLYGGATVQEYRWYKGTTSIADGYQTTSSDKGSTFTLRAILNGAKDSNNEVELGTVKITDNLAPEVVLKTWDCTSNDAGPVITYDGNAHYPKLTSITLNTGETITVTDANAKYIPITVDQATNVQYGSGSVQSTPYDVVVSTEKYGEITIPATFKINPLNITTNGTLTVSKGFEYNKTGNYMPSGNIDEYLSNTGLSVTVNGKSLKYGTEFNLLVAATPNEVGSNATVGVEGIGNYTGALTVKAMIAEKEIKASDVTLSQTEYDYDGNEKKPTVTVSIDEKTLTKDTDYTVSYSNNTQAGTATVTVTGKGNYKGTVTKEFTIKTAKFKDLVDAIDAAVNSSYTYTGKSIDPVGNNAYVNGKYYKNRDFKVEYVPQNVNAGTVRIKLTGLGNFAGAKNEDITFDIAPRSVKDSGVKAEMKGLTYSKDLTETQVKSALTLTYNGMTLVENTDYTVVVNKTDNKIVNNNKVNLTITGKGNYADSKTVELTISAKDISTVTLPKIEAQKYTGYEFVVQDKKLGYKNSPSSFVPVTDFVLKDGSKELSAGTDFVVSRYENNKNVGTATIHIIGKGNYTGNATISFPIVEQELTGSIVYKGSPIIPDQEYSYAKVSKFGGYTFDFDNSTVSTNDDLKVVKPDGTVIDSRLYKVTYSDNTAAGTATITVEGKDGYKLYAVNTFKIVPAKLSSVVDTSKWSYDKSKTYNYTGEAVEPKVTVTATDGTYALVKDVDYKIVYSDNVNATTGLTAKITLEGLGNYAGVVTETDKENKLTKKFAIGKTTVRTTDILAKEVGYAGGIPVKPDVVLTNQYTGKALVEGTDYTVELKENGVNVGQAKATIKLTTAGAKNYDLVTTGKTTEDVTFNVKAQDLSNVTINAIPDQVATGEQIKPAIVVMNGKTRLVEGYDYEVSYGENKEVGEGTVTIKALASNKNYTGSQTAKFNIVKEFPVGTPVLKDVVVAGNKATAVLSGAAEDAEGYDFVVATADDYVTGRVAINKNRIETEADFYYLAPGTYYAYCHAWKRGEDGRKVFGDWSKRFEFTVEAVTPETPVITGVKAKGNTVTVTYTKAANADGYDVVLGSAAKKVNGEYRPVEYGKLVKKNIKGNVVTATFKNVKKGTYYAGLHAFNRTSEDGKKVFSQWSNVKKVTVK